MLSYSDPIKYHPLYKYIYIYMFWRQGYLQRFRNLEVQSIQAQRDSNGHVSWRWAYADFFFATHRERFFRHVEPNFDRYLRA
jgi:hypothetical protein